MPALITTNAAALAALVSKATGDYLSATEYDTILAALKEIGVNQATAYQGPVVVFQDTETDLLVSNVAGSTSFYTYIIPANGMAPNVQYEIEALCYIKNGLTGLGAQTIRIQADCGGQTANYVDIPAVPEIGNSWPLRIRLIIAHKNTDFQIITTEIVASVGNNPGVSPIPVQATHYLGGRSAFNVDASTIQVMFYVTLGAAHTNLSLTRRTVTVRRY